MCVISFLLSVHYKPGRVAQSVGHPTEDYKSRNWQICSVLGFEIVILDAWSNISCTNLVRYQLYKKLYKLLL